MDWIIGKEWSDPKKGLSKKVLALKFEKVQKPTALSICRVKISKVANLADRPSSYLRQSNEFELIMGSAITPVDFYLEIILQNMLLGETCQAQIQTKKSGEPIEFEIFLSDLSQTKHLFQLSVKELYDLAQKYRSNGVEMFKMYPKFAHEYFSRAAKCLISFKPFDVLTEERNSMNGADLEALLRILQANLAACLLQDQRNEDVLYLTEFIDSLPADEIKKWEKALYRRALAFYNIKDYEKVLTLLEKVENIKEKKEFLLLYNQTKQSSKREEEHYRSIVQRMFN